MPTNRHCNDWSDHTHDHTHAPSPGSRLQQTIAAAADNFYKILTMLLFRAKPRVEV